MKRDIDRLIGQQFDILVVGGGIHGACVAWDAALRGLKVALVERDDFGAATSANSLKIIHGGLRYLQDLHPGRVREMARERSIWLRIAPHLVRPLPCLLPTSAHPGRHRVTLALALALNDWLSRDGRRLPRSRLVRRGELARLAPDLLEAGGIDSAAHWHDAQMFSSERLLLAFILSAAARGAVVANYAPVVRLRYDEAGAVCGALVHDRLAGRRLSVSARLVINCAGAWVDQVASAATGAGNPASYPSSVAINLVTRQLPPDLALGVTGHYTGRGRGGRPVPRARVLFIVPWRQVSLIGTLHMPLNGDPDSFVLDPAVVDALRAEINAAYPPARLAPDDIYHVHVGFLPALAGDGDNDRVRLLRDGRVRDHAAEEGRPGLITVIGVKYTTARYLAERAVDLALKQLGSSPRPSETATTALLGGERPLADLAAEAAGVRPAGLAADGLAYLLAAYGSQYRAVLAYLDEAPAWANVVCPGRPVIGAELVHAVRQEMATSLADVVLRRTELGAWGPPGPEPRRCLAAAAAIIGPELGWDAATVAAEIEATMAAFPVAYRHAGAPGSTSREVRARQ